MAHSPPSSSSRTGLAWFSARLSSPSLPLPVTPREQSLGENLPLKIHSQLCSLLRLLEALPGSDEKQNSVKYSPRLADFRCAIQRIEAVLQRIPEEEQSKGSMFK